MLSDETLTDEGSHKPLGGFAVPTDMGQVLVSSEDRISRSILCLQRELGLYPGPVIPATC